MTVKSPAKKGWQAARKKLISYRGKNLNLSKSGKQLLSCFPQPLIKEQGEAAVLRKRDEKGLCKFR